MDFKLTDKQLEIQKSIREYCQQELAPKAAELDKATTEQAQDMMKARLADLGQKGFLGLGFPAEVGGNDEDLLCSTILLQELGDACPATAMAVLSSIGVCARALYEWGGQGDKEQYLSDLLAGKIVGAYGSLEPDAGLDTWEYKTTAVPSGKGFQLNGSKCMALNAPIADLTIVTATANEMPGLYLISQGVSGFEVAKTQEKLGCRGLPTADLSLNNCAATVLTETNGEKALSAIRSHEHLMLAAMSAGLINSIMITAGVYARDHEAGGEPIGRHQEISFKLADTYLFFDTSLLLIHRCVWLMMEKHPEAEVLASSAKLFASESAVKSTGWAMQIMAQNGYCHGTKAERLFRDAKLVEILGDTTEKHRMYIADQVLA